MTQAELATKLGIRAPAVTQWETGRTRLNGENLIKSAKLFAVNPEWLLTGKGNKILQINEPIPKYLLGDSSTEVRLPLYQEADEPGDGIIKDSTRLVLSAHILQHANVTADHAAVLFVQGDNMLPVLPHQSLVAIDTRHTRLDKDGDIYAVSYNGLLRIHRLFKVSANMIRLGNYNHNDYPEQQLLLDELTILGRAFWWAVHNLR